MSVLEYLSVYLWLPINYCFWGYRLITVFGGAEGCPVGSAGEPWAPASVPAVPGWSKHSTATPGSTPHYKHGMAPGAVLCLLCLLLLFKRPGQRNERAHQRLDPGGPGGEGRELQHCHLMSLQCHHCHGESSQCWHNSQWTHLRWPCSQSRACYRDLQGAEPASRVCTWEVWQGRHRGEPWGCHLSGVPWPVVTSACRPHHRAVLHQECRERQLLASGSAAGTTDPDLILDQHFLHIGKVQHLSLGAWAAPSRAGKPPRSCLPPPPSGGSSSLPSPAVCRWWQSSPGLHR